MAARFAGKVVVVTGGGSGIGRTTALAFAREGATVVAAGRGPESLTETVDMIEAEGGSACAVQTDVTASDQVARLVATTVDSHGRLDIAFNNAGYFAAPAKIADLDEHAWRTSMEVNVTALWLCMKHEIAHMRSHGGGVIVNTISNIGAHATRPGLAAYAASKSAAATLTKTAAVEYASDGIRINAVSPGPTDTAMSQRPGETAADRDARVASTLPIGRVGRTDEIAATVLWLASPESSFVVGHDIVVDGGATA
jgi:NAD(P)-dependent dehydrogenase (short-subunit alcohol dehydrogenase family)